MLTLLRNIIAWIFLTASVLVLLGISAVALVCMGVYGIFMNVVRRVKNY